MPISDLDPRHDEEMRFYARGTTNMLVTARVSLFLIRPGLEGAGNPKDLRVCGESVQTATGGYDADPFSGAINFGLFMDNTGGRVYCARNDVDKAMVEAQAFGSEYYTLTYQPEAARRGGRFRAIQVLLRDPHLQAFTKEGITHRSRRVGQTRRLRPRRLMYGIEEAAQSEMVFDTLGMSLVHVVRHPDSGTVEMAALLNSDHLRW